MSKIGEDYERKYLLLEVSDKKEKEIIIDALEDYIAKSVKEIESYSKSDTYSRADDVIKVAAIISKCMKWRDNILLMGSDTSPRDFDFYKNGIERII